MRLLISVASATDAAAALAGGADLIDAKDEGAGVVAVAYGDVVRASSLGAATLVDVAAHTGAEGLLIDTWDKKGPGLRGLIAPGDLERLVAQAHRAGLFVAL